MEVVYTCDTYAPPGAHTSLTVHCIGATGVSPPSQLVVVGWGRHCSDVIVVWVAVRCEEGGVERRVVVYTTSHHAATIRKRGGGTCV